MPRRSTSGEFDPHLLYNDAAAAAASSSIGPGAVVARHRPPPSSFSFPYANAAAIDPLPLRSPSRQSSDDSFIMMNSPRSALQQYSDDNDEELPPPSAPFMRTRSGSDSSSSNNSLYRSSAGAAIAATSPTSPDTPTAIPRSSSMSFRAPFLSPSSRPGSRIWNPPPPIPSPNPSTSALPLSSKPPMPSTRIPQKLSKDDKPWLKSPSTRERLSWWITLVCIFLGIGAAAVLCYTGISRVQLLDENDLCLVMDEDWANGISDDRWSREAGATGFGNGEFQVHTAEDENAFVRNGELYILPTLMSDKVGRDQIFDGGEYTVANCYYQETNNTACSASSSASSAAVLPPVLSARLTTKGKASIAGGKVEFRAKLPRGDWLWPAVWMMPEEETYGRWPMSGEIDILEARGNSPSYGAQGNNFVRSSINYGPMEGLVTKIYGWWQMKRGGYDKAFHTYTLEWTSTFMRFYIDSRLQSTLTLKIDDGKHSFLERGDYPPTAMNISSGSAVVVPNPWQGRGGAAPYDQAFYLIISLSAGGTSGWFPDDVGDKPWHDGSQSAMADFARAQDTWAATWPESDGDRAMRVGRVRMWGLGGC